MIENQNPIISPSESQKSGFTYHLWENKIVLSIILAILVIALLFIENAALFAFIIALFSIFICYKRGSFKDIGLIRPKSFFKTLLTAFLTAVIIQLIFSVLVDPLTEIISGQTIDLSAFDDVRGDYRYFLVWLLIGWVVGGFAEEMTFRGYMMSRIIKVFGENAGGKLLAVLLTAVPFGLAHLYQGLPGMISTGLFGFIFAFIYLKYRSNLWLLIFIHGFVDTVGFILIYFSWDIYLNHIFF